MPAILQAVDSLLEGGEGDWRAAPRLKETYFHPTRPSPSPAVVAQAEGVMAGEFRVAGRYPIQPLGRPPDWGSELTEDHNWLSSLHGLEWLAPLFHAHAAKPEGGYLESAVGVARDWIEHNPFRGAPSRFSWHDHAAAKRLRLFAWLWEQYRGNDGYAAEFARLLLASVYQHARYHLEERNYGRYSNHGLEAIGALWAAAVTFPFFRAAPEWEAMARRRAVQWVGDNLSTEGFHLEQSPSYHWFVLLRLAALDRFLAANERSAPELTEATERAARVWPHLLQPNGVVPGVGDSSRQAPANWRRYLESRWGRSAPATEVREGLTVSPRAGHAIFRAGAGQEPGVYVLFRCHAFISTHCHCDALSFVLHGLGRDWIVDPGYLNYHDWDRRRHYLRSPRAHSLVVIGESDFRTGNSECLEWGSAAEGEYVVAYHDLPQARHTRRVQLAPAGVLTLTDQVQPARRKPVPWVQLFQVAPDLTVEIVTDREAQLIAEGARCVITQSLPGKWQVIRGQTRPRLQGWYSEAYGKWEPGTTLVFRPPPSTTALTSVVELRAEGQADQ